MYGGTCINIALFYQVLVNAAEHLSKLMRLLAHKTTEGDAVEWGRTITCLRIVKQ